MGRSPDNNAGGKLNIRPPLRFQALPRRPGLNSNSDIGKFWGEALVKIPGKSLISWSFPEETLVFLENVGLPLNTSRIDYLNILFAFHPSNTQPLIYETRRYLTIGEVGSYALCIEERTGEVFMIAASNQQGLPKKFVNSNVSMLLKFLEIVLIHKPSMRELANKIDKRLEDIPHEDVLTKRRQLRQVWEELVGRVESEFRAIDEKALSQDESYWSLIIRDWLI